MSHYVANEHSGHPVGDLKDLEEVTANSGGGAEEMVKSQRARLRRSRTGKSRISLRQQSVLQLARRLQVLFQLCVLLTHLLQIFGKLLLSLLPPCNVPR